MRPKQKETIAIAVNPFVNLGFTLYTFPEFGLMQNLAKFVCGSAIAALSTVFISGAAKAQLPAGQSGFFCNTNSGVPTTVYQNRQGQWEAWINWRSNHFSGSGYDPLTRCREVSSRLETYRRNRQLKYVTVGKMNGQDVICTASQVNGRCAGLIYTLRPNQDAVETLYQFFALREGQAGTPALQESTANRPYIDVGARLDEAEVAAPTPAPLPPTPAPQNEPSQPTGGGELREL